MADPAPSKGLPEQEFVELKNTSHTAWNLRNWKLSDAASVATITTNFLLQPDSFVIICSLSGAPRFTGYGAVIGVTNFPSLDNDGEWIMLQGPDGRLVHSVLYAGSWYANELKQEGGWTLEMIDPLNACSGASNWTASMNLRGGTPGSVNSVNRPNADKTPPRPVRSFAPDSLSVVLVFDEPLDSASAAQVQAYSIGSGIGQPRQAIVTAPLFEQVRLQLGQPLTRGAPYTLRVTGIRDCSGNKSVDPDTVGTGLAAPVNSTEVVINEILFNPRPGGADYVELYNRSSHVLDLKEMFVANRAASGTLANLHPVYPENKLLFPGEWVAVTESPSALLRDFPAAASANIIAVPALPSLPDDKGILVLLNGSGAVIDELRYDEKWHFPLLDSHEGVALERVDFNKPAQDPANWHSAASTAGYGTPGYRNSQYTQAAALAMGWTLKPAIFSPDNDGYDDIATLYYQLPEPGWVCNITVYDARGVPVRWLVRNALCEATGSFRWEGLDEKGRKMSMGVYIARIEAFDLKGKTAIIKKAITLLRRLN